MEDSNQLGEYYGCWYLGSWHCHIISSHDIDFVKREWIWLPFLKRELKTCNVSVSRNCSTHWPLLTPYGDKRTWSTLVQVMAYCLMAPSHYLNLWWLFICEIQYSLQHSPDSEVSKLLFCIISLKIIILKLLPHLPGANELICKYQYCEGYP